MDKFYTVLNAVIAGQLICFAISVFSVAVFCLITWNLYLVLEWGWPIFRASFVSGLLLTFYMEVV